MSQIYELGRPIGSFTNPAWSSPEHNTLSHPHRTDQSSVPHTQDAQPPLPAGARPPSPGTHAHAADGQNDMSLYSQSSTRSEAEAGWGGGGGGGGGSSPGHHDHLNDDTTQVGQNDSHPKMDTYEHNGVLVPGVAEGDKPKAVLDEQSKASNHRTGAEAAAPLLVAAAAKGDERVPVANGHAKGDNGVMSEKEGKQGMERGAGAPAGPPGGRGPPKLEKYKYNFFDPEMAFFRKIVFKILGGGTVVTIIIMWLALPMYWGSLWLSNVYTNNLTVRIIDYDGGLIGTTVTQGLLSRTAQLGYYTSSTSEFPTADSVIDNVLDEGCWAAITINPGATANLTRARQNGIASYNGSAAISVYYAQARNELAENSYLQPYIVQALGAISAQLSAQTAAQYIGQNSGNATAMALLAQAPSTISQGVFYTLYNLRPYNQPVATAITLVGLIYMLIFAFIITMMNNGARDLISPYLNTRSYILYRLAVPLILYLPVALLFSMINLPFRIDFDAHFSYAGGYFLWFLTTYLGMCALGFATEFAITVVGPKFIGFFLVAWIIVNVSVVALPHELQPWIFRYGVAMPFYNINRTVRTIIFNTKNDIAMNLGIILAWIALSMITVPLATWLARRGAVNQHRKAKREVEDKTEKTM